MTEKRLWAYIGRFAFSSANTAIISDWRSPIASLFYENELGKASYEAPSETISGEILLKRQLEIKEGELIYAVDTNSSLRDEVLQHELSKVSDQKMSSIVSSIQKEQNEIIRNTATKTLVIQGVAILSPNPVFGDYISKVLPELGEEPINQFYLPDMFSSLLGTRITAQPMRSFVDGDAAWQDRAHNKGSFKFCDAITGFLEQINETIFEAQTLSFGKRVIEQEWLTQRFKSYGNLPYNDLCHVNKNGKRT